MLAETSVVDPEDIYHWFRLDERITTSGQPMEGQLADLAGLGVKRVVNLAPHDNAVALADEARSVQQLGMDYSNIPVDFKTPSEEHFEEFCCLMTQNAGSTLHIHCAANYRVSAFLYRYRRDVEHVDEKQARSDLERVWQPDPVWTAFISRSRPDPHP